MDAIREMMMGAWGDLSDWEPAMLERERQGMGRALAALREPAVLEALCRSIAVGSSRIAIEIPEYGSMHVNAAVYLISAVLGAALGEG